MDAIKKFFDALYRHYDKVLLGVLLILLSVVMWVQYQDMKKTREDVKVLLSTSIQVLMGKPNIPEFDTAELQVNIEPDLERLWQIGFNSGAYATQTISPNMDPAFQEHILDNGPSTIFDPLVYVAAMDGSPYALDYSTQFNPFTGLTDVPKGDDDDDDDDDSETTTEVGFPEIYIVAVSQPKLPFVLKGINMHDPNVKNKWDIQVSVISRNRWVSQTLRMNDEIPGTSYVIVDAGQQQVMDASGNPQRVYQMTVENRQTKERISLRNGQQKEEGLPRFKLKIVYKSGSITVEDRIVESQKAFSFPNQEGKIVYYMITDRTLDTLKKDRQLVLRQVSAEGSRMPGTAKAVYKNERDFARYLSGLRQAAGGGPDSRPRQPGMDPGMAPDMMPDGM